ncbi:hypothetical protein, partial [Mycoplasma capricolum]|uniref:hypothetical protein n=1 Tax=Mycoplasma capricolum TaxID=2095 RepID=UPI0034DADB04
GESTSSTSQKLEKAREAVKNAQAKVDSTKAVYEKAQKETKAATKPEDKKAKEKLENDAKAAYDAAQNELKAAQEVVKKLE